MKEIEVKILDIDKNKIIKKLKKLGAKKLSEGKQKAILFDFKNKSLSKNKKLLRLRQSNGKIELTFKQDISKKRAKIKKEYETDVESYNKTIKILDGIGLISIKKYGKHRISFRLKDIRFEIDTNPGIPTFLEIEAPNLKKLKEIVNKLDYNMKDTKPWSGYDVLKYYGKR